MEDKSVIHFGLKMASRTRGYELTRQNYAAVSNKSSLGKNPRYIYAINSNDEKLIKGYSEIYADNEGTIYKNTWCQKHLIDVMENFDLNMKYFEKLNPDKFENEIVKFIKKTKFIEITDLNEYSCSGYYIMILDKYCQLYIGTTQDIKKRIRKHWSGGKMSFDRLIFGPINKSKLSIDSFRALDTSRILVYPTNDIYSIEDKFINCFSQEFIINRINGGKMEFGELSVLANMKTRNFK